MVAMPTTGRSMPTLNGNNHQIVTRCIITHTLRAYGDIAECCKVLQQAINSVSGDVELLYDSLLQLEQDKGLSVCMCIYVDVHCRYVWSTCSGKILLQEYNNICMGKQLL